MIRLEQITALVLAAGLAIPSYWFFWTLAGGGGYDQRGQEDIHHIEELEDSDARGNITNHLEP